MSRRAVERQLIGGILEMMNDSQLFHKSNIGENHQYSRWSSEGQDALLAFVTDYSRRLLVAQDTELDARAKSMTWQTLKEPQQ